MIYIFTISTGIYNTYLNTFIDSINNCFTNKEKTVVIIHYVICKNIYILMMQLNI